eukprot:TRINITY_DN5021_c0_g1_i4.p2 TRINITY_DN5021_c0_g1~~TRINITY_DN5021_c0_g1_i4.p2  ORF type:complete len:135 (+),score=17.99 TRINITY_DN5021_c0_g1_i4:85-489(+)
MCIRDRYKPCLYHSVHTASVLLGRLSIELAPPSHQCRSFKDTLVGRLAEFLLEAPESGNRAALLRCAVRFTAGSDTLDDEISGSAGTVLRLGRAGSGTVLRRGRAGSCGGAPASAIAPDSEVRLRTNGADTVVA